MFQKFMNWIRERLSKMLNISTAKQMLHLDVAVSNEMAAALVEWSQMYLNQASWLDSNTKSLNLAATIASEFARAVTIEMEVEVSGSPRAEFLDEQLDSVLDNIRLYTEFAAAKGGLIFKPYLRDGQIAIDFIQADMFYPINFDSNGRMTACVFADTANIGSNYFTRLEYHALVQGTYQITNTAYKSTSRDYLGTAVPLASVPEWENIEPEAFIQNVEKPLFAYFKMPLANNVDVTSPLGVSVYARAVELIEQADTQWSDFLWEFESGKRALYTDPNAFTKDKNNKPVLPDKRLYRLLDLQGNINQQGLFQEWTPTLREVNILNGLDAILKRIEFACGLAQGTISDPSTVALTATEIKMSKQRTYATIADIQKSLEKALEDLLYAMDVWVTLGNLAPAGKFEAVFTFDDSIVADHDTQFLQDSQAVSMGVMSKVEFRMKTYGETQEMAMQKIAMIANENQPIDFFNGS